MDVPRFPKVGSSVFQLLVNKICFGWDNIHFRSFPKHVIEYYLEKEVCMLLWKLLHPLIIFFVFFLSFFCSTKQSDHIFILYHSTFSLLQPNTHDKKHNFFSFHWLFYLHTKQNLNMNQVQAINPRSFYIIFLSFINMNKASLSKSNN